MWGTIFAILLLIALISIPVFGNRVENWLKNRDEQIYYSPEAVNGRMQKYAQEQWESAYRKRDDDAKQKIREGEQQLQRLIAKHINDSAKRELR